jgi:Spy/CpxP family protein refolding chaperone
MSMSKSLWVGGVAILMGSALYAAKPEAPAPAADAPAAHHGKGRLTKPWNELKDLTDDEKVKVLAIHQKAIDEIHDIEAKEHADILAVLTPDQKKEIAAIEAKEKAAAHDAKAHKPTTQPAAAAK